MSHPRPSLYSRPPSSHPPRHPRHPPRHSRHPSSPGNLQRSLLTLTASLTLALLLALFPSSARASALTTTVAMREKLCFYAWVDKPLEKVGVYFAVQSGGSFDITWVVTDPSDMIILEGERERQGDFIFTAQQEGEYTFCFSNYRASLSDKVIDIDIMVESEPRRNVPAKPTSMVEQTTNLEESIYKLSGSLSSIQRTHKYFRTRENRNTSTVRSTQRLLLMFSIGSSALMIGMSSLQVFIVRKFFNQPGKYVRV